MLYKLSKQNKPTSSIVCDRDTALVTLLEQPLTELVQGVITLELQFSVTTFLAVLLRPALVAHLNFVH